MPEGPTVCLKAHACFVFLRSAVRGLADQAIVRSAAQLRGGAFAAQGLQRCTLWLAGPLAALRLAGLRDCRVLAGPVAGATFIDGAYTCTNLAWMSAGRLLNPEKVQDLAIPSPERLSWSMPLQMLPVLHAGLITRAYCKLIIWWQLACWDLLA